MKNWNELLVHEIEDLYDAEKQLVQALPKLAQGAEEPALKQAFESHLAETEMHVQRLEQVARMLGAELGKMTCEGMKGLIKEGDGILKEKKNAEPEILDAALTGAAQKVEHYEIVAYESAIHLAEQLGLEDAVSLLEQTLEEEIAASEKLSQLSGEDEAEGLEEMESSAVEGGEPARTKSRGRKSGGSSGRSRSGSSSGSGSRSGSSSGSRNGNGSADGNDRPRDSQGRFVSEDEGEESSGGGRRSGGAEAGR